MKEPGGGSIVEVAHPSGDRRRRRWRARIRIAGRVHSKTLPKKSAAQDWLKLKRREKILADADPDARLRGRREDVTFGELAPGLLGFWESGARAPRGRYTRATLTQYRSALRKLLEEGWADRQVRRLSHEAVDSYVADLRDRGLSTGSIRGRLHVLDALAKIAVRRRLVVGSLPKVDRPGRVEPDPRPTSDAEARAVLDAAREIEDPRVYRAVVLAAGAGLRRGEIARIRAGDVRLLGDDPDVFGWIRLAVRSEEDRPKSGRARDVPIYSRELATELEAALEELGGDDPLLPGIETESGVGDLAERAWKAALGPDASVDLHGLRRRWATRLAHAGVPVPKLREWLGHRSLETTQRYIGSDPTPARGVRGVAESVLDMSRSSRVAELRDERKD